MSEKMFRYIKIGGTIGVEKVWELIVAMSADGVLQSPVNTSSPIRDKLSVIDDNMRGEWLWVETISQGDTSFEYLEQFCDTYKLPYDRHVVSEWSYSGNVRQHRPGAPDCVKITSTMTAESITPEDEEQVLHLLDEGDAEKAMQAYDTAVVDTTTALPPFQVV